MIMPDDVAYTNKTVAYDLLTYQLLIYYYRPTAHCVLYRLDQA